MAAFIAGALPAAHHHVQSGRAAHLGHRRQRDRRPGPHRQAALSSGAAPDCARWSTVSGGLLAMGITYLIGALVGTALV